MTRPTWRSPYWSVPWSPTPELGGSELATGLAAIVGPEHALVDADLRAGYERDWTGRFVGTCSAVVRPGSVDEVAAVLAWCDERLVAVVPQGGNTGLVGGGVPAAEPPRPTVVLSLRRLDTLGPVDAAAGQVTAGAGVTLAALHAGAHAAGWAFGVDLAARDSATVGGLVATNAGGLQVVRWGAMRHQVLGVEAVLAGGRVVSHLGGLVKDNTGYDLAGLVTGSEGTLAVVTQVRLRLVPPAGEVLVAFVGCASAADAVALAADSRRTLPGLLAIEAVWRPALDLVTGAAGVGLPVEVPADGVGVVIELEAGGDDDRMFAALEDVVGDRPAVAANDPAGRQRLWQLRERVSEVIAHEGVPHKLDVTLPLSQLAAFAGEVRAATGGHRVFLFGHLGDGNVHVNVVGPAPDDDRIDDAVLRLTVAHGGSISAEHGIGRAKRPWLHLNRTPAEIDVFRAIKAALDPNGILNPGVLLPDP